MNKILQQKISRIFQKTWVQHFLFWLSMVALFTLFRTFRAESLELSWKSFFLETVPLSGVAGAVYFNLKILLPRYLTSKKYLRYVVGLLSVTFINAALVYLVFHLVVPRFHELSNGSHPNRWLFFPAYMTMQIMFTIITSFFHFLRENSRLNEIALSVTEIEKSRLGAELTSLKAQINPHFLFNTLNNIYSYSLFKSKKTPDLILKLSNLMNYIIYECQADEVPLNKEIEFIHNYIDLEKLRVEDSIAIQLDIMETSRDYSIAPLLFIPFLENAFKHGANISGQAPFIRIALDVSDVGELRFECENLADEDIADDSPPNRRGIGLENVRKRLELLYSKRYSLDIQETHGRYTVHLQLNLQEAETK